MYLDSYIDTYIRVYPCYERTGIGRNCPKQTARMSADQTGSVALSTCVNEMAPENKG